MLTGVFLFWFVFSFCVFNLLHAFKSLTLFPPSGKTVARYFGATSGLRFCSLSWNCFTKTSRSLHYVVVRCCFCSFGSPFAALTVLKLLSAHFVGCAFAGCPQVTPLRSARRSPSRVSLRSHPPYAKSLRPTQIRLRTKRKNE